MNTTYLINNKIVRLKDYIKFFNVSPKTARKMLRHDREEFGFARYTYFDFFILYRSFPSRNFVPNWGEAGEKQGGVYL